MNVMYIGHTDICPHKCAVEGNITERVGKIGKLLRTNEYSTDVEFDTPDRIQQLVNNFRKEHVVPVETTQSIEDLRKAVPYNPDILKSYKCGEMA